MNLTGSFIVIVGGASVGGFNLAALSLRGVRGNA